MFDYGKDLQDAYDEGYKKGKADAVRHGRWIDRCEDTDGIYEFCSECGIDTDITHYGKSYAYCPNCGAKMDEGGTDGTDDC